MSMFLSMTTMMKRPKKSHHFKKVGLERWAQSHSGQVANKTVTIGNADKQGRQHFHFLYPYNVSLINTFRDRYINVEKGNYLNIFNEAL